MEMLVVLLIVGIVATLLLSRTVNKPKRIQPEIISFLRDERANSLKLQQTTDIRRYTNRLYSTLSEKTYALPTAGQDDTPENPGLLPYTSLTRFFPDGTMTANKFTITEGSINYVIQTSPFSSSIKYSTQ